MMSFAGQRVVITGKFVGISRAVLRERITAAGGIVTGRLSGRTGILLAGIGSAEKKLSRATELGVAVVTAPELDALFAAPAAAGSETTSADISPVESGPPATHRPGPRADIPVGFLAEDAVNAVTLRAIFARAYFRTTIDADGDLVVETEEGPNLFLISQERRLVCMIAIHPVKEFADEAAKFAVANRMNKRYEFAQFSITSPVKLTAEYTLPFDQGLGTVQLVRTLRRFVSSVSRALETCDEEEVLDVS